MWDFIDQFLLGEVLALCKSMIDFLLSSVGSRVHLVSPPGSRLKQSLSIWVPAFLGKNLDFACILLGDGDMTFVWDILHYSGRILDFFIF